jgi:hypothetical protein
VRRMQERSYASVWIEAADLEDEGLLLSRHMLLDHFPDRALAVIELALQYMQEHGVEARGGGSPGHPLAPPTAHALRYPAALGESGADAAAASAAPDVTTGPLSARRDSRGRAGGNVAYATSTQPPPAARARKVGAGIAGSPGGAGGANGASPTGASSAVSRASASGGP